MTFSFKRGVWLGTILFLHIKWYPGFKIPALLDVSCRHIQVAFDVFAAKERASDCINKQSGNQSRYWNRLLTCHGID